MLLVLVGRCCLLASLGVVLGVDEASFTIKTKTPSHVVSDKFISFVLNPAQLTQDGLEKAVTLARAMAPAYVRLEGGGRYFPTETAVDSVNEEQWNRLTEFATRSGLDMIAVLDITQRRDDHWDATDAVRLMTHSGRHNTTLHLQLGHDMSELDSSLSGAQVGQDVLSLRSIMKTFSAQQNASLFGPDIDALYRQGGASSVSPVMAEYFDTAAHVLDALTLRVRSAERWTEVDVAVLKAEVDSLDKDYGSVVASKPVWIAESTRDVAKSPGRFSGALAWAHKLGVAAQLGVDVVFKQPLLINQPPTPEYWVSLLHKMLIGRSVLENKMAGNSTDVHLFSQCARSPGGAIAMFGVNAQRHEVEVNIETNMAAGELQQFVVTSAANRNPLRSKNILLNGEPVTLDAYGNLPVLLPKIQHFSHNLTLTLPPTSVVFWVIPGARVLACTEGATHSEGDEDSFKVIVKSEHEAEVPDVSEPSVKNITYDKATKVITDKDWDEIKDKYLITKFMFVLKRDPAHLKGSEAMLGDQDVITVSNDETFGQRFSRALADGLYTLPSLDHTLYQPATFKNPLKMLRDPLDALRKPLDSLKRKEVGEEVAEDVEVRDEVPEEEDVVEAEDNGEVVQPEETEYMYVDDGDVESEKVKGTEGSEILYGGPSEVYEALAMDRKKVRDENVDYGELWEADTGLKKQGEADVKKMKTVENFGVLNRRRRHNDADDEIQLEEVKGRPKKAYEVEEKAEKVRERVLDDAVTFIKDVIKDKKRNGNVNMGLDVDDVTILSHVGEKKKDDETEAKSVQPTETEHIKSSDKPVENQLSRDVEKFMDPKSFISDLGKELQTMKENARFKFKHSPLSLGNDKDEDVGADRNVRQSFQSAPAEIRLPNFQSMLANFPQSRGPMTMSARAEETIKLDPVTLPPMHGVFETASRKSKSFIDERAKNLESAIAAYRGRTSKSDDNKLLEAASALKELDVLEKSVFKLSDLSQKSTDGDGKTSKPVIAELENLRQKLADIGTSDDDKPSQPQAREPVRIQEPQLKIKTLEFQLPQPPRLANIFNRNAEKRDENMLSVKDVFAKSEISFPRARAMTNDVAGIAKKIQDNSPLQNVFSRPNARAEINFPRPRSMTNDVEDLAKKIQDNSNVQSAVKKTKNFFSNIGRDADKEVGVISDKISGLPKLMTDTIKESPSLQSAVAKTEDLMSKIDDGLKSLRARSSGRANEVVHLPDEDRLKESFDVVLGKLNEINSDVMRSLNLAQGRKRRAISSSQGRKLHRFNSHKLTEEMYSNDALEGKKRVQRKSLHNIVRRGVTEQSDKPIYTEQVNKMIKYYPRESKGIKKNVGKTQLKIHQKISDIEDLAPSYYDLMYDDSKYFDDSDWFKTDFDESIDYETESNEDKPTTESSGNSELSELSDNKYVLMGYKDDQPKFDWENWKKIDHSLDFADSIGSFKIGRFKRYIPNVGRKMTPEEMMENQVPIIDDNQVHSDGKSNFPSEVLKKYPQKIVPKLTEPDRKTDKKNDINLMVHISAAKDLPHFIQNINGKSKVDAAKYERMMIEYQKEMEVWRHMNENQVEVPRENQVEVPRENRVDKTEIVKVVEEDSQPREEKKKISILRKILNKITAVLDAVAKPS